MNSNLLMGGVEELGVIKNKVIELNQCMEQKKTLDELESQLEKNLAKKEKESSDEVINVTRQRRAQIEQTIDEQIDDVNEILKKVQSNKDKTKKKAVNQRIDTETSEQRNEEEELNLGGKAIFKQENIPFLYNNRLFFALFFPSGIGDYGIILLSLTIAFFVLPFGLYYILFNGMNVLYLALCYMSTIVIFGGLYLVLGKTKYKHNAALNRVREIRKRIQINKREQRNIKRQIRKDKDESAYGLQEFDAEIENLQRSINELLQQKQVALIDFDKITSQSIKDQIISNFQPEINALAAEYNQVSEQNKENLNHLNELSLIVNTEYEGYLGKEFLSIEKIEQMEGLIASGSVKTISEAMAAISKNDNANPVNR